MAGRTAPGRRTEPTMRGKALMWLSQREHSRHELGQKLKRWLAGLAQAGDPDAAARCSDIDPLLDALSEAGHLSDERFVESRIHARSTRFGNRRIELELRVHGAALDESVRAKLRASESERAKRVRSQKFGAPARDASDRARQARFLAGRGFSPEAIKSAVATSGDDD